MLAYVQDELIIHEMNPFDAALALIALAISVRGFEAYTSPYTHREHSAKAAGTDRSERTSGTR